MAWNKQLTVGLLVIALLLPAPMDFAGTWVMPAMAGADSGETEANFSIASPAFLQLNLYWADNSAQMVALDLDDVLVFISGDTAGNREVHENPIIVEPSSTIRVRIYGKSYGYSGGDILYDINYTSGVAGSYRVMTVSFDTNELASSSIFVPVRVIFRPYDNSTGVGFPVEQFNITVQFQDQDFGTCTPGCYTPGPELPIGLGYIDTYYGLNMTVRARDYFGNILYNQTRVLRFDNASFCNPVIEPEYAGQCTLFSNAFQTWDIPLQVYSFKVYNQKPDQFIKVKLFWNGSGAGEEVFAPNSGLFPDWWNSAYTYRHRIIVNTSSGLNTSFDYNMSFDVSPYTASGKVQSDLRDLRVAYYNFTSMAWTEVNRSYNATTQRLYFKSAAWLPPGTSDRGYFIYYGNALAGAAPSFTPYRTLVLSTSNRMAYWPLDETSGSTFVDITGLGSNCALTGSPTVGVQAEVAKGINWGGGTGKRLNCGHPNPSELTLDGWFQPTGIPAAGTILVHDQWGGGAYNYELAVTTSNTVNFKIFTFSTGGGTFSITSNTTLSVGYWYHIAGTYGPTAEDSRAVVRLYINGTQDATPILTTGSYPNANSHETLVGYNGVNDRSLVGIQDEWVVSSRALTQLELMTRYEEGIGQNGTGNASLESANAFEWFESPTETVERFLNPGYYEIQIITDNRTGVQTKANLGVNITEANYYMVSGTNITRFIGDFNSIFSQTQVITNAFRPDVIEYGELLPTAPTQIKSMSVDEGAAILIHPFSVLTGTAVYIAASGTNVTSYMPDFESESSNDGTLLKTITVKQDQFVFSGSEPHLTHVWINYTSNGTNIWENGTLPPVVTLAGIQGDVYVVTNRTVQTTRMSAFQAVWEFSFAYYATTKRYEAALTLNNTMNRTVYEPYWFVGFPENRTINMSSAAVKDLDNNVWLTEGQQFAVSLAGYYMTFQQLNASSKRSFFFQFFDLNSTADQNTLIRQVSDINRETFDGSNAFWYGDASFSHDFSAPYRGDLVVKLTCSDCQRIRWETVVVEDLTTGRRLDTTEFLAGGGSVTITGPAVGELGVGEVRNYRIHFQLVLDPAKSDFSVFGALIMIAGVGISVFLIVFGVAIASSVMFIYQRGRERKQAWFAALMVAWFFVFVMFIGRAGGGLNFIP